MNTSIPARALRYRHECRDCAFGTPAAARGSIWRLLQAAKDDCSFMADLRDALGRSDDGTDLARATDDRVIDQVAWLMASGRLHVCSKAAASTGRSHGTRPAPPRPQPSPRSATANVAAATTASGAQGNGQSASPYQIAFSGGREAAAAPAAAKTARAAAEPPVQPVLHWFTLTLKAAPELKARPAWWPVAATSPVGYGGTQALVNLRGVSPPEQKLDAGGRFHVDLVLPGSAKVQFRDYFSSLEPVFKAGSRF